MLMIGDAVWVGYRLTDRHPFPSPADLFYLASFPLIAAGLVVAVSRRTPYGVDARAAIDAAVLTVVIATLSWVYIARPVVDDESLSTFDKVVTPLYPAGDLLLFAVAARFVLGSSWNKRSMRMLVLGLAVLFIGDSMFALGISEDGRTAGLFDAILLAAVVLMGAAALDPTMRSLTEEEGDPAERVDRRHFLVIAGAAIVPAVILLVQELRGEPSYVVANLIASLILVGLIAMRAELMTSRALQAAERETTLSRFTAEILAARDRDGLYSATRRALSAFGRLERIEARLVVGAEGESKGIVPGFVAPVMLRGESVAVVVADAAPSRLRRWRTGLSTIASQLSIALERDRLLATEQATAASFAVQNARLLELDTLKDRFVSSVTHELRTPLTSMVGYLELLRDGEVGELNPEQQHMFEIIDRNCRRLDNLIGDILVTARFDSGRLQLHLAEVDVADVVANEVQSIAAVAGARGVRVHFVIDEPGPPHVIADERLLSQLLANLLSNAVKFTASDGNVTVTLAERGGVVMLDVQDTGVGIPSDDIEKIFERFYRASTAETIAGTGLGLSIVKAITEAHGGTIEVTSALGVGTTFHVELPLSGPHDTTTASQPQEVNR